MGEESYPMKGGDDNFSYANNSSFQKSASSVAKGLISEAITEKLNIEDFLSPAPTTTLAVAPTIRIADLGCSVGPNTFTAMQNVIDSLEAKYKSLPTSHHHHQNPQFQVFFNDHTGNDFNTLFKSLPSNRSYFSSGVPGSFYGRLFPDSSLHIIHSSYALQWLTKAPEELLAKESPAWNGGRIHYTGAPPEVVDSYARQFSKDMGLFLESRAQELVTRGMMVLIMPCIPDQNVSHSQVPAGVMFDLLGASLLDMVKAGVISQAKLDSFNLPIYAVSPNEMEDQVAKNGRFRIAKLELTNPSSASSAANKAESGGHDNAVARHLRAGMEGVFAKHFGVEFMDELFDRFSQKTLEFADRFSSCHKEGTQMFIALVKQN